jgi:hypothetical protein
MSASNLEAVKETIRIFQDAGAYVVLTLPPVAGQVAEAMTRSGKYRYVDELARRVPDMGVDGYNFHDPRTFGSSDCEFVDGIHGGEVAYLRMLSMMAHRNKRLAAFVSPDIDRSILRFAGRVNAYEHPLTGDRTRIERDFLQLGCVKGAVN